MKMATAAVNYRSSFDN